MQTTTRLVVTLLLVFGFVSICAPTLVSAAPPPPQPAQQQATVVDTSSLPKTTAAGNKLQMIINVALGIVGAASLLVVSIGGMRYVFAHGEPNAITQAKNTILYALIGLIVVIIAGFIVNFVVENVQ